MKVQDVARGLMAGLVMATLAQADTYQADPAHSEVSFLVPHLVINKVRGQFTQLEATLEVNGQGHLTAAQATIQAASINTANDKRDTHLRSPEFFDTGKFPELTFKSTSVEMRDGKNVVLGDLTMHGVTREVALAFILKGPIQDPWGNTKLGFEASTTINRTDYGLSWNKVLEAGGVMVGEEVAIEVNLEVTKQAPAPAQP